MEILPCFHEPDYIAGKLNDSKYSLLYRSFCLRLIAAIARYILARENSIEYNNPKRVLASAVLLHHSTVTAAVLGSRSLRKGVFVHLGYSTCLES